MQPGREPRDTAWSGYLSGHADGTPDAVLDEILRLHEEIGLDYLLCAPLSHETFMMLTEKILPRLP